jgi:hypothetical protein
VAAEWAAPERRCSAECVGEELMTDEALTKLAETAANQKAKAAQR